MSRFRTLLIGHTRYAVRWSKAAVAKINEAESGPGHDIPGGICSQRFQTIAIEPLPEAANMEREIMLHEVLHACLNSTSLQMTYKQEELFVQILSPRLLSTLRDNPRLVEYLLS